MSDPSNPAIVKPSSISVSLDNPRLIHTDPESIHAFLRKYDQYATTVIARARQLTSASLSTEAVLPVELKFCMDAEFLESSIALGLIKTAKDYESLTDAQVREFLDARCASTRTVVTLDNLDRLVQQKLHMNMRNNNAKARVEHLFTNYQTLLKRNGMDWVITENQKVAVQHVLSAIWPQHLLDRLTLDLSLHKYALRKDFQGFFAHALDLAESYHKLDILHASGNGYKTGKGGGKCGDGGRGGGGGGGGGTKGKDGDGRNQKDELPLCLWEPNAKKGLRHLLKDCRECPHAVKKEIYKKRPEDKARDGPASGTRSQRPSTQQPAPTAPVPPTGAKKPTPGRLKQPNSTHTSVSPTCHAELHDGPASHTGTARCDDGSDESIASPSLAQSAVIKGIGRMEAINPIRIQVAIQNTEKPSTFTFSRRWHVPRLILHLSAGKMALLNLSFLVADDQIACEDLLIGHPVLQHLDIDSRTLLEQNLHRFDGTDCTGIDSQTKSSSGNLGRLMLSRLQGLSVPTDLHDAADSTDKQDGAGTTPVVNHSRPRSHYFNNQVDDYPFTDPFLIDQQSMIANEEATHAAITEMIKRAKQNGFPMDHWEEFELMIWDHAAAFSTRFSTVAEAI